MSKTLSKIFNTIYPFSDFLYILQLEGYETKRYFKRIRYFFFKRGLQKRERLQVTSRVKLTFVFSLPLGIILPPLIPIWVGVANTVLTPFFEIAKAMLQKKATIFFKQKNKNTYVIAVAGSFGKTTVKNYIYEIVRYNYKSQMIPGNINTPTGIASWILDEFDPTCTLLIVEVDTYFPGEIKKSLAITPPDISILTNIEDQHLERFKSKGELSEALLEVFKYSKKNAIKIKNKKTNLAYALEVAKILNIPKDIIKDTLRKLSIPERRGNITTINGFETIDASYNISKTTAKAGILKSHKLALNKNKKLLVITAGIPELGKENKNGNVDLGKYLKRYADRIILLKSIFYKDIEKGVGKPNKLIYASSMTDALTKLGDFKSNEYLVLMQPELNDLYYIN